MRPSSQPYDCCALLKCVSLFPKQRWWWRGKGLHVRLSDWVWTELLHTLCINPGLKLHLGWKRSTQMPRRACGTEIKSGPPSLRVWLPYTYVHTHTFHLFVKFSFHPLSCFILLRSPCFWDIVLLYGHSYCSTVSVMCIYCSICEIGGTGWQAYYYSITGAGHFHERWAITVPDRAVASCQFRPTGRLLCCCQVLYWGRNFPPSSREKWGPVLSRKSGLQ